MDESGVIRWRRDGGFSNVNAADREAVRRFAGGDDPGPSPAPPQVPYALGALERELVATHLKLASVLDASGRRDEALVHWQAALERDPENLTIRKAIWAARFPERFDPAIDNDWQTQQLKVEREVEIAAGICGPDGCPIPR